MSLILLIAALGLVAMPGLTRHWVSRLRPVDTVRITLAALVAGVTSLLVGLALCAAPLVVQVTGLPPGRIVGAQHFFPGGSVAGWLSLAALALTGVTTAAASAVHFAAHRRLIADAAWAQEEKAGNVVIKVLPTDERLAFALPSPSAAVVVSRGTLEGLDTAELDAVVRHELSHLRHHHHRYLLVADVVERLFGQTAFVGRSTAVMRLALEKWADDEAIIQPHDRSAVRSALIQIGGLYESTIAAFSEAEMVAGRLEHLANPTTQNSALARTLFASAVVGGTLAAASAVLAWLI